MNRLQKRAPINWGANCRPVCLQKSVPKIVKLREHKMEKIVAIYRGQTGPKTFRKIALQTPKKMVNGRSALKLFNLLIMFIIKFIVKILCFLRKQLKDLIIYWLFIMNIVTMS